MQMPQAADCQGRPLCPCLENEDVEGAEVWRTLWTTILETFFLLLHFLLFFFPFFLFQSREREKEEQ